MIITRPFVSALLRAVLCAADWETLPGVGWGVGSVAKLVFVGYSSMLDKGHANQLIIGGNLLRKPNIRGKNQGHGGSNALLINNRRLTSPYFILFYVFYYNPKTDDNFICGNNDHVHSTG